MKKQTELLIILICLVITATSCSHTSNMLNNRKVKTYDNITLIYNPIEDKIVKYNFYKNNVDKLSTDLNDFQTYVPNSNKIYICGNSINNGYSIQMLTNKSFKQVYRCPDNEAIFPIGYKNNQIYLIHSYYDNKTKDELLNKRRIGKYNFSDNTMTDYNFTEGLISYGSIKNDEICYSVYSEEDNNYRFYKINIDNINNIPEKIDTISDSGLIVSNKKDYYISNNGYFTYELEYKDIEIENQKIKVKSKNYLIGYNLIQFDIDEKGSIYCEITNLKDNTKTVYDGVYGARIMDDGIRIYYKNGQANHDFHELDEGGKLLIDTSFK